MEARRPVAPTMWTLLQSCSILPHQLCSLLQQLLRNTNVSEVSVSKLPRSWSDPASAGRVRGCQIRGGSVDLSRCIRSTSEGVLQFSQPEQRYWKLNYLCQVCWRVGHVSRHKTRTRCCQLSVCETHLRNPKPAPSEEEMRHGEQRSHQQPWQLHPLSWRWKLRPE